MVKHFMAVLIALVCQNFATNSAASAEEPSKMVRGAAPFEFKGQTTAREFETPDAIRTLCNFSGRSEIIKTGSGQCIGQDMVAGIPGVMISYEFRNKKLFGVYAQLDERAFPTISAAFIAKYGQPTSQENSEVQNRLGAKFENTRIMWAFIDGFLTLRRYASSLDKSAFSFTHIDALAEVPAKPKVDF